MGKVYYLGIDLGTASIGWCVTDAQYNILRVHGKDMWGIRMFKTAETATARRVNRNNRKRLDKEKARIALLRLYFADEIEKIDKNFFARLDNSQLYLCDKPENIKTKNIFFNDVNYTDKDYFSDFPTVFHLRKALLDESSEYDARFLYLAISSMFKHRGHFLLNNVNGDMSINDIKEIYEDTLRKLEEKFDLYFNPCDFDVLISILGRNDISRTDKCESIAEKFGIRRNYKKGYTFIKCLCGLSAEIANMFDLQPEEIKIINFSDFLYSEKIDTIEAEIGEENFEIINGLKQIYDFSSLKTILGKNEYLSESRVEMYNKHHEDLLILKKIYKKYKGQEEYDSMFRSTEDASYSAYVNVLSTGKKPTHNYRRNMNKRGYEELYARIKKDFKGLENNEDIKKVLSEINKETFLPKQMTGANGTIPNQVHLKELSKILENAERYMPFLKEIDSSGKTVSERIKAIFSFQIPYYIGPVGKGSKTGWSVRKTEGTVLPWNMEELINVEDTSEAFINKMIRNCTYLNNEKVLPKASLLYERFCLLNEINNITVNGNRLPADIKQKIYVDLFESGKKVSKKKLCTYLIGLGVIESPEQVGGIDIAINNSLSSYGKMYAIFGEKIKEDKYKNIAEEIIYWSTIFGESKKMLRNKLEKYIISNYISEEDAKRILGYKFKDWARVSKELLTMQGCEKYTKEITSIINVMWENNLNFMEIINSERFNFKELIEEKTIKKVKSLNEFEYEDLNDYYFSTPVKRMIWQTILLCKEIVEVMGNEPKKIFIEMTRSDEEKGDNGRTKTRCQKLLDFYDGVKDTTRDWKKEIIEASESGKLMSKKLYLYYMQMGKDLYTGKEIDINELFDDNLYDIDHIYPRHYVKDDSITNNLVLVNKHDNECLKKDIYPLPESIVSNSDVRELWNSLHSSKNVNIKLMSDEKYRRLTDRNPFTDEQRAGFIERQLVETSQGTKTIAKLFEQLMPNTRVIYSKASNVSKFRHTYKLYKSRIANDFHHAHDAYLNIVVGNVYDTKFTQNPLNYIKNEFNKDQKKNNYNLNKMYEKDVYRNGEYAWIASHDNKPGTIKTVKTIMDRTSPLITEYSYVNKGELFNLQPLSHHKASDENYIPLKKGMMVERYGGYTSLKPAYFVFIEYGPEKKRKKAFDVIHSIVAEKLKTDEDICKYFDNKGYINTRVIANKIKKMSLLKLNGYYVRIAGMDNRKNIELHNAVSLFVPRKYYNYIHDVELTVVRKELHRNIDKEKNIELYDWLTARITDERHILSKNPKSIGSTLKSGKEKFVKLSDIDQVNVLYKIIQIYSLGSVSLGLKEIGGGSSDQGRIRISGNMTKCKELLLIEQSITGVFVKERNLLKE